jgi:hypothetical protein
MRFHRRPPWARIPMPNTAAADLGGGPPPPPPPAGGPPGPPPPPAPPPPAPWFGDLPTATDEEKAYRAKVEGKGWKTPGDALKSYFELETRVGNAIQPWKDGEDPSQWGGWDKLGAPKDAAGFKDKVKLPQMPEGVVLDEKLLGAFFDTAGKGRMLPHHAQQVVDFFAQYQGQQAAELKKVTDAEKANLDALYDKWGVTKKGDGSWDVASHAQVQLAQRGFRGMGMDGELATQLEGFVGGARLMEFMAKAGALFAEGKLHEGQPGGNTSKEQALARIAELDKKHIESSLTKDEKAERSRLFGIAYPSG